MVWVGMVLGFRRRAAKKFNEKKRSTKLTNKASFRLDMKIVCGIGTLSTCARPAAFFSFLSAYAIPMDGWPMYR